MTDNELRALLIDREALMLAVNLLGGALDDVHGFLDHLLIPEETESGIEFPRLGEADMAQLHAAHNLINRTAQQLGGIIAERDRLAAEVMNSQVEGQTSLDDAMPGQYL